MGDKSHQRQAKEAQLSQYPAWPAVSRSEQQLAALQQQLEEARAAVAARQAEADHSGLAGQLVGLLADVNAVHLASVGVVR